MERLWEVAVRALGEVGEKIEGKEWARQPGQQVRHSLSWLWA